VRCRGGRTDARREAGWAGHDREIVVNIDGYDHGIPVPDYVFGALREALPESWYLENRGSRIEIHPSGRFAGGFHPDDVEAVKLALAEVGLVVAFVSTERG
jgi:hypothetical protein